MAKTLLRVRHSVRVLFFLFAVHLAVLHGLGQRAAAEEIRIGIQVFRGQPSSIGSYDTILADVERGLGEGESPLEIKVAVGTHKDILSWGERGLIDVAIVSPVVFAGLTAQLDEGGKPRWRALVSEVPDGARSAVLPPNVVAATQRVVRWDAIATVLIERYPGRFVRAPEWEGKLNPIEGNLLTMELLRELQQRDRIQLPDFGKLLLLHRCTQAEPLRIAVVFAGGGAKCSYQVGAVEAVEGYLASLRDQWKDPSFDIALTAGTSGGALNALPVALGVSLDPEGRHDFADIWRQLDQRDLIRPSLAVRVLMVLWFVCLQGVVLLRVRRERHFKNPEKHPWIISPFFFLFGAMQIIVARLPWKPWSLLGTNSLVHHIWLWLSWGLEGSGWVLVSLAMISWIVRRFRKVADTPFPLRYRVVRRIFWVGIVVIPAIQTINILFYQPTLSNNTGIERAIVRNYRSLIDRHLARAKAPLLSLPAGAEGTQSGEDRAVAGVFRSMSEQIVGRHLLLRDLILTGSALPQNTSESPGDLYFFAHGKGPKISPRFGARGVSLDQRPGLFMDVLMGSGAIYPVFPARTLADFPRPGNSVELVDGSFEHRSPVEAAVLWGATHVLVIQAATDEVTARGALLENIMAAMNHLYDQAQLLDFRSREHTITVTLTPQPPHIGLLDFSDNLIDLAINKGRREANGEGENGLTAMYRKELSEPIFWSPPMVNGGMGYCEGLGM